MADLVADEKERVADQEVAEVKEKSEEAKVEDGDAEEVVKDHDKVIEEGKASVVEEEGEAKPLESEKEEDVKMESEPKTGVSFPVKLADGKQLASLGVRRKKVIAININIYAFGIYADNAKLNELVKAKFPTAPLKPTKELFEAVIDSDVAMVVRLIIVFGSLTMNMVKNNFDEGLGAAIKKLNGGKKNEELANKVLGAASTSTKLSAGSVLEISRLPGHVLKTKVKDEEISEVESELLCRAFFDLYLGDDPFDKEAKERFGKSLLSLF